MSGAMGAGAYGQMRQEFQEFPVARKAKTLLGEVSK